MNKIQSKCRNAINFPSDIPAIILYGRDFCIKYLTRKRRRMMMLITADYYYYYYYNDDLHEVFTAKLSYPLCVCSWLSHTRKPRSKYILWFSLHTFCYATLCLLQKHAFVFKLLRPGNSHLQALGIHHPNMKTSIRRICCSIKIFL